jgi:hypothetical protein
MLGPWSPGALYLSYLSANNVNNRLYWEYGGRILGRAFTPGLIEWVQHGTGTPLRIESAVAGSRGLAPYTDFTAEYPPGRNAILRSNPILF